MRLDRFITLNLVQPVRRTLDSLSALGREPEGGVFPVSILMYHSVSEVDESARPYYVTNTHPAAFREQMRFLANHNYRVTDLETALNEPALNERTVVITFDDGFRDFYTTAFPILREFGFTATMFLPTALIGGARSTSPTSQKISDTFPRPSAGRGIKGEEVSPSPHWGEGRGGVAVSSPSPTRLSFKGRDCMTWDEVRTLASEGIHFGSHTVSHPKLYDLDWPQIEEELTVSKETLEKELDQEITTFAYPFAYPQADRDFTRGFETLLQKVGYRCNVTTRIGRAKKGDPRFSLRRLPMNSFDDPILLQAKLKGGYDWLAQPQALVKKVKHCTSQI